MDQKGGYGIVYREIMRSKELTPEAKAIYAYLCSFAGSGDSCYPSAELMRIELQMGSDRFYKHMHLLTDAGIVRKEQGRNGNRWGSTVYRLNHTPDFTLSQNGCTENRCTQNESTINNSFNNNSNTNNRDNNFGQHVDRICELMNAGRVKNYSHGRLNKKTGAEFIEDLTNSGFSIDEILKAAAVVGKSDIAQWTDLYDALVDKRKKGAN